MRIGILGGTFDPIHFGHLYLAKKVCQKLKLKKVIFIPTYLTPHKRNIRITSAIDRYRMASLAIKKNKRFEISDIEVKRKGRSYTAETLRSLRKKYVSSAEIFFITGSDSLRDLNKWKGLRAITKLCKFIVVKRPGFKLKAIPPSFLVLKIDARDISATLIRKRVKEGKSTRNLLPQTVRDYIDRYKLYKE